MDNLELEEMIFYSHFIARSIYLVDCVWSDWVNGECSQTCGHGTQTDTRGEFQSAQFGGIPCDGEPTRHLDCFIKDCPSITIFYHGYKINGGLILVNKTKINNFK